MTIRKYKKEDIQKIVKLYNETTKKHNWSDLNDEQKKIMLIKDVEKAHNLMKSSLTTVLEIDNKIIGFTVITNKGYINFFYIDKNELKKGYGKILLSESEKKAKKLGIKNIFLYTSKYTSDRGIYEKLGYVNKGLETYKILNVEFEGYRMEKNLE